MLWDVLVVVIEFLTVPFLLLLFPESLVPPCRSLGWIARWSRLQPGRRPPLAVTVALPPQGLLDVATKGLFLTLFLYFCSFLFRLLA